MAKELKVGVHAGDDDPSYRWTVLILDLAHREAGEFLTEAQYRHVAEQVQELTRETDPTHAVTQTVRAVEDFWELKDKGGVLGKINVRVFFVLDKPRAAIVVLGAINKKNEGPTPFGDKARMKRRARKYFAGDYGTPAARSGHGQRQKRG